MALGALARGKVGFSEPFMFGLGIGAYGAWLSGTALGAFAGGAALEGWPVLDAALAADLARIEDGAAWISPAPDPSAEGDD